MRLPGTNTIPEQISRDRSAYYKALEAADESLVRNKIDLSKMEEMLEGMLAEQLLTIHKNAKQVRQN
jgi:hypothetical protein